MFRAVSWQKSNTLPAKFANADRSRRFPVEGFRFNNFRDCQSRQYIEARSADNSNK